MLNRLSPPGLQMKLELKSDPTNCDSIILISKGKEIQEFSSLYPFISFYCSSDAGFFNKTSLVIHNSFPGNRLIHAPLPSNPHSHYQDVRVIQKTVRSAFQLAVDSGSKRPFLMLNWENKTPFEIEAISLALLQQSYIPLNQYSQKTNLFDEISLSSSSFTTQLMQQMHTVEQGKSLARIIAAGDPEFMNPTHCAKLIHDALKGFANISVESVTDASILEQQYPLLFAVGRASMHTPKHAPVVVKICYSNIQDGAQVQRVHLIGKGITYDTGGADLKVNGAMIGMSRDKCGAATLAGFMLSVAHDQPVNCEFTAYLAFVRNSIGSASYVSDELLCARSGKIVRVGNTDAEGRMVMVDLICEAVESCKSVQKSAIPPTIVTCATLTGHACRAYGDICAAIVPNSVALQNGFAHLLASKGELLGEPFEISRLRGEDFEFIDGRSTFCDYHSANNKPSTMTDRGHQYPGAFLIAASGLLDCEVDCEIQFLHLDVAATSDESFLGKPTAFPLATLYEVMVNGKTTN